MSGLNEKKNVSVASPFIADRFIVDPTTADQGGSADLSIAVTRK